MEHWATMAFSCLMATSSAWGLTSPPSQTLPRWPAAMVGFSRVPFLKMGTMLCLTQLCSWSCLFFKSKVEKNGIWVQCTCNFHKIFWKNNSLKYQKIFFRVYSCKNTLCNYWSTNNDIISFIIKMKSKPTFQPGNKGVSGRLTVRMDPGHRNMFLL